MARSVVGAIAASAIGSLACGMVQGDLDGDGVVGGGDLTLLLLSWGACPPDAECPADLDGNGTVDGHDQSILLQNWGLAVDSGAGSQGQEGDFDSDGLFESDPAAGGIDPGGFSESHGGSPLDGHDGEVAGGVHVVPLPAPALLLVPGAAMGLWWRRRWIARWGDAEPRDR
jgi:hypothetical protein